MRLDGFRTAFYIGGVSALLVHEMDAVMFAEWRLLFGLRDFPDSVAYPTFLLLHLPILFTLLWFARHPKIEVQRRFRFWTALFLPIHACIHMYVSGDPEYGFVSLVSNLLIYGSAMLGLIYLALGWRQKSDS